MKAKYLTLVKAVQEVTGTRPHLSTCIRWATYGSKGIILQTVMLGGRRLTTIKWFEQFIEATTNASTPRAGLEAKSAKTSKAMKKAAADLHAMFPKNRAKVAI